MASAKKVPIPVFIELTLSNEEASALKDVCDRIGGDANTSRRRYFDAIARALYAVGVLGSDTDDIEPARRSIYFE